MQAFSFGDLGRWYLPRLDQLSLPDLLAQIHRRPVCRHRSICCKVGRGHGRTGHGPSFCAPFRWSAGWFLRARASRPSGPSRRRRRRSRCRRPRRRPRRSRRSRPPRRSRPRRRRRHWPPSWPRWNGAHLEFRQDLQPHRGQRYDPPKNVQLRQTLQETKPKLSARIKATKRSKKLFLRGKRSCAIFSRS